MKRLFLGAAIVALVSVAGTASAQAQGCKTFGAVEVSGAAQELRPFGQVVASVTPVNDDVAGFHEMFCE
jgi:hypothetical protein